MDRFFFKYERRIIAYLVLHMKFNNAYEIAGKSNVNLKHFTKAIIKLEQEGHIKKNPMNEWVFTKKNEVFYNKDIKNALKNYKELFFDIILAGKKLTYIEWINIHKMLLEKKRGNKPKQHQKLLQIVKKILKKDKNTSFSDPFSG